MSGESSDQTYLMNEGWSSLAAELWRRMADRVPSEEVDFYAAKIRANGGAALDVGCGAGRGGMPSRWLPRRFATIIVPNGSFQILTERPVAGAVLERFQRHLAPGGELLIDFGSLVQSLEECTRQLDAQSPWTFRSGMGPSDHGEIVTRTWVEQVSRFDQRTRETREYQLIVDGKTMRTERHTLHLHYYSKHEAELLLEANGFRDIRWFADLRDAAPVGDGFRSIIRGARGPD